MKRLALVAFAVLAHGTVHAADLAVSIGDAEDRPLAEAVVYISGPGVVPRTAIPAFVIDQRNRQFEPRIAVVQTGTAISFPNSDQIRHSVYSFSPAKPFTLKLYSGQPSNPVVFDRPGVVVLGCNIHDRMSAWVLVVDTPAYAKTDAAGRAVLRNLRPGDYVLSAWYPGLDDGPVTQKLTLAAQEGAGVHVKLAAHPIGEGIP